MEEKVKEGKSGKGKDGLDWLNEQVRNSWIGNLLPDPETAASQPNKTSRQVKSGHYVLVKPDPLPNPWLVAVSPDMLKSLGLRLQDAEDPRFVRVFSGDIAPLSNFTGWATPYALSIYGQEMYQNCPFGNGNGYGDGRAISIAEVLNPITGLRWELQLKGGGRTPFCRGADGRAVLRSSVREFLASEAMWNLGVSTTRALSLVASKSASVRRPWYTNEKTQVQLPSVDDPRLRSVPMQFRKQVINQFKMDLREPDQMQESIIAITTRVAPSFLRVGHLELFGRRARSDQSRIKELEMIVEHALFREYPEANTEGLPLQARALEMARLFSKRLASLTADWIRVGFCQGNFNSDNCLVGGRTMDYGPFGFIEKFEPLWNMWVGGGEHFAFLNQPTAGAKNFESFASALNPLLDARGKKELRDIAQNHSAVAKTAVNDVWRRKLGLANWTPATAKLTEDLLSLMESGEADYTIFWRQLALLPEKFITTKGELSQADIKDVELIQPLANAFYKEPVQSEWSPWLRRFLQLHLVDGQGSGADRALEMRRTSPKYVPREWMLVAAYTAAIDHADPSLVRELQRVFAKPYDEHPTEDAEEKWYRKADHSHFEGVGVGGTSFMS